MKKRQNDLDTADGERLTERELSRRLGRYQRAAALWLRLGLLGIAGGVISYFAVQDAALKAVLTGVLFSGGLFCAIFLSREAQKKLKALMQEQMGDLFRAELERAFGPDLRTADLAIDRACVEQFRLLDGKWEECVVEDLHQGTHRGVSFSAANVRLDYVYERGSGQEGLGTCQDMVFKGVVIRCQTRVAASGLVRGNARTEDSPRGIVTENGDFNAHFCVTAEREQDAFCLLTPQFMEQLTALEGGVEGHLAGFCWEGRVFSLTIETDYGFASVASSVDLRDLDALQRSYITSLKEMGRFLDLLLKNTALFAARD